MTNQELVDLMQAPYQKTVWSDGEGIKATLSGRNIETRTVDVPVGIPGIIEAMDENSLTIRWDHYYFENHRIQECLPNPVGTLDLKDLGLIRKNKYPANVRLIGAR